MKPLLQSLNQSILFTMQVDINITNISKATINNTLAFVLYPLLYARLVPSAIARAHFILAITL